MPKIKVTKTMLREIAAALGKGIPKGVPEKAIVGLEKELPRLEEAGLAAAAAQGHEATPLGIIKEKLIHHLWVDIMNHVYDKYLKGGHAEAHGGPMLGKEEK